MIKKILPLLLLFVSLTVQAEDKTAKQQLKNFLQTTDSFSARFQQKLVDQYGYLLQQSAGHLSMERPGRFRWDYILPYPQNIISNGKKIWMYDSELEQVNVRPYDQILASSPVKLLDNKQQLEEAFEIEAMPGSEGQLWLKLIPRETESDFREMHIGMLDGKIKTMRFTDNFNQLTEILFEQLLLNPQHRAEHFEFVAPPGTDVIGDF